MKNYFMNLNKISICIHDTKAQKEMSCLSENEEDEKVKQTLIGLLVEFNERQFLKVSDLECLTMHRNIKR